MMNDSVREELKDKISIAARPIKMEVKPNPPAMPARPAPQASMPAPPQVVIQTPPQALTQTPPAPLQAAPPQASQKVQAPAAPVIKPNTSQISVKPTSPTLVEFQNKNATLPDWRLQLQNAVRKRVEKGGAETETEPAPVLRRAAHMPTSGANALKAEAVEQAQTVAVKGNPKLENALRRIEESRKKFLSDEHQMPEPEVVSPASVPVKNYPFRIASRNSELAPKPAEPRPPVNLTFKPKIEDLPVIEKKEFDTNRLPALTRPSAAAPTPAVSSAEERAEVPEIRSSPVIKMARVDTEFDDAVEYDEVEIDETSEEEIEDLAPISMRFNAGLFDLLIGSFAALILLSPLMLSGGNWYSLAGFLAFLVTCSIVMFIYMTTAIGLWGKTLGMKIFSLETIDIEENDYPTFHQAAVSSCVYLVSLALGGIGFLPAFFNAERRTAPDLLSGTVVVKEY